MSRDINVLGHARNGHEELFAESLTRTSHQISSRGTQGIVRVCALVVLGENAYLRYAERANRESVDTRCALQPAVGIW